MKTTKKFSYLIDQQMSEQLIIDVGDPEKSFQPITVRTIFGDGSLYQDRLNLIDLSKEQAQLLGQYLLDAAAGLPDHDPDVEYPGKVIS